MTPTSIVTGARSARATSRSSTRRRTSTSPASTAGYESLGQCACGGSCPRCRDKHPRQTELAISEPGDVYEKEAERVADILMRVHDSGIDSNSSTRPIAPIAQRRVSKVNTGIGEAPPIVHEVLATPGQRLDVQTRAYFEPRFGYDFRDVRIHSDAISARSVAEVNALAYTAGSNIVFGRGRFSPDSSVGRRLLAHELAHVVQQSQVQPMPPSPEALYSSGQHDTAGADATTHASHAPQLSNTSSDAQICLQRATTEDAPRRSSDSRLPLCPEIGDPESPEGFLKAMCSVPDPSAEPPDCKLTRDHKRILRESKRVARDRVRRAWDIIQGDDGMNRLAVAAGQLFSGEAPSPEEITDVLREVQRFLRGSDVDFSGKGCGEAACRDGKTRAWVTSAGTMPIYVCPLAFAFPEALHRTILHESFHFAGVDVDPSSRKTFLGKESYCENDDCATPCLDKNSADAWAHFVDCLGQQPEANEDIHQF